jgi:hypothetical protein
MMPSRAPQVAEPQRSPVVAPRTEAAVQQQTAGR